MWFPFSRIIAIIYLFIKTFLKSRAAVSGWRIKNDGMMIQKQTNEPSFWNVHTWLTEKDG